MRTLFRFLAWRHASTHRLRTILCILTIALGVALYVSMETSQESTLHSFEAAHAKLAGKAAWRVTRGRGLPVEDSVLEILEDTPGVLAAPVLEQAASLPDYPEEGRLLVLGVDFLAEARMRGLASGPAAVRVDPFVALLDPASIYVARAFAERHHLHSGAEIRMSTPRGMRSLRIAGVLEDQGAASVLGGRIAFTRFERAQWLFAREGWLDRIDIMPIGADDPALGDRLQSRLGADYVVERVRAHDNTLSNLIANMRSLIVLSVIALMVGLFIVYLSVSIGVVERARAVGTLRALGATRRQIQIVFLLEAAAMGLAGSVLGIALGYGLAHVTLHAVSSTVNMLVSLVQLDEVVMPQRAVIGALVAGTATSVLAGYLPARRASTIPAVSALRPAILGAETLPSYGRIAIAGLLIFAAGVVGVVLPPHMVATRVSLGCTAMLFLGVALMMPQATIYASRLVRTPLRALFRVHGFLAADNVLRYPQRSALTVVAVGGALAILVTSASVIDGMRVATDAWLVKALPFDLSIQPAMLSGTIYSRAALPADLPERVGRTPGVAISYGVKVSIQGWRDCDIMLIALAWGDYERVMKARGFDKESLARGSTAEQREAAYAAIRDGRAIAMSKNFGNLFQYKVGDELALPTPRGERKFPIVMEFEDYSWPQGVLFLSLEKYRELWADTTLTYVDLMLQPGVADAGARKALAKSLSDEYTAFVYSGEEVRNYGQAMVSQSFAMMHAQVVVAMAIGLLGIINTLLISVLQRTREIGLLRVVGMTRREVAGTVLLESLFVSIVGGALGIASGLFASKFPGAGHMLRMTGHQIPFVIPWTSLAIVVISSLCLGFVASILPARRAASLQVLDAIGYE